jgi:two-component system OmpR family response regulator
VRILLIEPDGLLAYTYGRSFQDAGFDVEWCGTAAAAIAAADTATPDAVVIELQLPAHSGVEFLYEFRSYPEWQTVPLIILSRIQRQDAPLSREAERDIGITRYLYKPATSLESLVRTLSRVVVS